MPEKRKPGWTKVIRRGVNAYAAEKSLQQLARETQIDVSILSRFAREERQMVTGDGLDRLVRFLASWNVTRKGEP